VNPTAPLFDIAEVARRTGTPASALRFYEEKGLIASLGRHGLRRLFDREALDRLAFIALGRHAGFSLGEIGRMLGRDGRPDIDRALLTEKADALDHTIRRLTALRDGLRHAADCPAPSHFECPTFQRLLAAAGRRAVRRAASPGSGCGTR
jgi:DNA-binding transcriptional MerR regulator